jgi:hypothetical protein
MKTGTDFRTLSMISPKAFLARVALIVFDP